MHIPRTGRLALALAAVTVVTVAGCASDSDATVVDETTTTEQTSAGVDLDSLDTGDYNTQPRDFVALGMAAEDFGPAVEGQRLAEFVIHPHTIDPALTVGGSTNGMFLGGTGNIFSGSENEILKEFSIINAFTSFRSTDDDSREFGVSVWRFPTPEDAAGAAQALYEYKLAPADGPFATGPETPISLPALPDTLATTYSWPELATTSLSTLTTRGMFVVYTYSGDDSDGIEWITDTATRGVQQQIELLDRFPATPTDEIASLPIDLDKVMARAVGFVDSEYSRNSDMAVYGPDGWLHYDSAPADTEVVFEQTGTDRVAKVNSVVYRTAGPDEAEVLKDAFAAHTAETYPDLVEDPSLTQSLPNTTCWSGDVAEGRAAACLMTYGRYMAELSGFRSIGNENPDSDTLRTVPQRVATQYVKFVRAEEMGLGEN
ncbi:hypothetical protein BO226_07975 [Rhodococcus sp. 2G]|uniref:DUF7373 family lipoprotein n=1 Tax=Rhodococcus sp. 2G TaxID=1570939 RepID=UPI000903DFC8|nr:hypothetical protein [Rhodococcus sp. 2G]APE09161.1 hypothetical protein BO226_07975 [Rhodococcus sp. 2G]